MCASWLDSRVFDAFTLIQLRIRTAGSFKLLNALPSSNERTRGRLLRWPISPASSSSGPLSLAPLAPAHSARSLYIHLSPPRLLYLRAPSNSLCRPVPLFSRRARPLPSPAHLRRRSRWRLLDVNCLSTYSASCSSVLPGISLSSGDAVLSFSRGRPLPLAPARAKPPNSC